MKVSAPSQVERSLWIYAFLVVLVTVASWAIYAHRGAFDTRPLFDKADQLHDLTNYYAKTAQLYRGSEALGRGLPVYNYPPGAAFVLKILLHSVPRHPVLPYLIFLTVCIVGFAIVALRASRGSPPVRIAAMVAIGVTALLGYPLMFTADRGNLEVVVWALSAAGLCFLLRGSYRTGALLIGVTASIKPFPILFLFLLVRRHKYKEAALGLAAAALAVLAALTILGPNPLKAYHDLSAGVTVYTSRYVMVLSQIGEARFEHSLLDGMKSVALTVEMGGVHSAGAVKEVQRLNAVPGGWPVVRVLASIYPFVAVAGLGLLFAVFYPMPILNQLTALGVAITLFPPSAGDYTLLHLYVPFGALVIFLTRDVAGGKASLRYSSMLAFAVIYALLFSPLTFLRMYASDAKLLLLIALLVVTARAPMPSAYFGDLTEDAVANV